MSAEFRPRGLRAWVTILDEGMLPVLPNSLKQLKAVLLKPDFELAELSDCIVHDPVMMVHLIREVNRCFKGKAAGTLTDIHHCISMLGLERASGLINQFRAIKGDPGNKVEVAYLESIMQSLHAAAQARDWHDVRKQAAPEQIYLATLLSGVPRWCLWRFAYKEIKIIETLQKKELIPKEAAENAVLGCTTDEIVLALAERWHFPDIIVGALNHKELPSFKFFAQTARSGYHQKHPVMPMKDERGRIVNTPSMPVLLANWLAQEVSHDWYSRQTNRCIAIVAGYLQLELHETRHRIQQVALAVSHQMHMKGVSTPAEKLIFPVMPPKHRRIHLSALDNVVNQLQEGKKLSEVVRHEVEDDTTFMVRKPVPARVEPFAPKPPPKAAQPERRGGQEPLKKVTGFIAEEKQRKFTLFLQRLIKEMGYYDSAYQLLREMVDVIHECTRIERVVVGIVDLKKGTVTGYYSVGAEQYPGLQKYEVALQPANFFTQLIKRPRGVWVHPDRPSDISALMPGSFKQVSQADEFLIHSIFNLNGPFAVLYADKGATPSDTMAEAEFEICRAAANGATKHLISMMKRARS